MSEIKVGDHPEEWLIQRIQQLEKGLLTSLGIDSMRGRRLKFEIKAVKNGLICDCGTVYDEEQDRGTFVFDSKEKLISYLKEKVNAIPEEEKETAP